MSIREASLSLLVEKTTETLVSIWSQMWVIRNAWLYIITVAKASMVLLKVWVALLLMGVGFHTYSVQILWFSKFSCIMSILTML